MHHHHAQAAMWIAATLSAWPPELLYQTRKALLVLFERATGTLPYDSGSVIDWRWPVVTTARRPLVRDLVWVWACLPAANRARCLTAWSVIERERALRLGITSPTARNVASTINVCDRSIPCLSSSSPHATHRISGALTRRSATARRGPAVNRRASPPR